MLLQRVSVFRLADRHELSEVKTATLKAPPAGKPRETSTTAENNWTTF
ncbi:hypothetical protein [Serratia oryzae]|nr:hypothetical protein [Serratia oryzae]VXC41725.1 hypothetical protein YERSI8AC_10104 [Enterobacterales bacterium 8AC]